MKYRYLLMQGQADGEIFDRHYGSRRVPLAELEGRADRYSGDTHELLSVWLHRPMKPASGSGKRAFRLLFVRCWALLFYIYSFLNGKDRYFS